MWERGSHRSETAVCGVTAAHWSVNANPTQRVGGLPLISWGGREEQWGLILKLRGWRKKRKALVCMRGVAELWLQVHSSLETVRARWSLTAPSHHLHFISLTALYSDSVYNLTVNRCLCCATGLTCSHRDLHSEILHFH